MKKSFKAVLSMIFVAILMSATMVITLAVGNVTNLKATNVTHNSATFTWSAASGADGYQIRPYTDGKYGSTVTLSGKSNTTYKATLTPGKSYYFYVRSYDKGLLKTTYGSWVKVAVKAVPAKVTNFKATNLSGGTSIKFTWTKVSGATGYLVQRYSASKKAYVNCGTTTGTSLTVKGLYAGTSYKFRVAAYVKYSGKNIYGSYVNLSATPTYLAPTSLKVSKTTASAVTLTWSGATGAQKFQVYNATTKKYSYSSAKSITLSGLEAGTKYQVRLRGYSKVSGKTVYGAWTSYLTFTTVPAKVTGLTATNLTQTGVDISFDKAQGALGYQVFLYDYETKTETKLIKQLTQNAYSITGLKPGKTYRIGVCSYVKNSTYFYSSKAYVYIETAPLVTTGALTNTTDIQLEWSQVRKATAYTVERYMPKDYNWAKIADVPVETPYTGYVLSEEKVSYTDAAIGANKGELYRITAYNGEEVINSVTYEATTSGLTLAKNDYSVTVKWDVPDGTTKYTVYKMPLEGYQTYNLYVHDFEIADGSTDTYTFYLAPDEYHSYMIYASRGASSGVAVATFTVKADGLVIDSTNESKNAQLLMLVNAINKTKLEKDEVTVKADTYAKMILDAIYFSEEMLDQIPGASAIAKNGEISGEKLVDFFKILVTLGFADESEIPETVTIEDPDPVTVKFEEGLAKTASGSTVTLRSYVEPSGTTDKLAHLYNQHNPAAWKNGFSSVATTYYPSTGRYKIVATLKQEKFGTSVTQQQANYHPGFVSVYDALGFADSDVNNELTTLGATKITAYIDEEGRIYNYSFTAPFTTKFMASDGADAGVGMKMSGTTTIKYTFSF